MTLKTGVKVYHNKITCPSEEGVSFELLTGLDNYKSS